jgi:hypothetical protein
MTFITLLEWWNLIYIVPFGLALMYLGLFVFTGITFGHADFDADADVDADLDADVEVSGPLHVEAHVVDTDTDADTDHDMEADQSVPAGGAVLVHAPAVHVGAGGGHGSALFDLLSLLGVGKIPLSLAIMTLFFSWGVVGFALNATLCNWMRPSPLVAIISLPLTLAISVVLTGLCAAGMARLVPTNDGKRQRREDLVGKSGEAVYDINASFGMANVRSEEGDFLQVPCRTVAGKSPISKGSRVVLFHYDREEGVFHVAPLNL